MAAAAAASVSSLVFGQVIFSTTVAVGLLGDGYRTGVVSPDGARIGDIDGRRFGAGVGTASVTSATIPDVVVSDSTSIASGAAFPFPVLLERPLVGTGRFFSCGTGVGFGNPSLFSSIWLVPL